METAVKTFAILLSTSLLLACGGEQETAQPSEPDAPAEKKAAVTDEPVESPAPGKGAPQEPGDTAAGASFLAPGKAAPADHKPIGPEDRAELATVYLSFAEDPEGFIVAVQKLAPDRRQRIAGYLLCASNKLRAAGRQDQTGAPVQIELPVEAKELIHYEGSPDKGRTMFLKQLGGEFLVVGRSIQSIDEGDTRTVEQILMRQQQNLEMMKLASPPEQVTEWSATIRRVFPILFARLIPEC
jgi:hypothetical protein